MKLNYGTLLITLIDLAIKTNSDRIYFRERIMTCNDDINSELYSFEMTYSESVDYCIASCKRKKQCQFINYDHIAKLCYHIGLDSTQFQPGNGDSLKDYLVKKPGFSYGIKRDWDMTGYEDCANCNDYGVCNIISVDIDSKCRNSGCKQPEKKRNAVLHGNKFSVGDTIKYECFEGFRTNTTEQLSSICLQNGTWSEIEFQCFSEAAFDDNAFMFGNIFFKFFRDNIYDWGTADELCTNQTMQLVNIKEAEMQNALLKIIHDNSYNNDGCFWMGGRRNMNGTFVWLDGETITDGHWGGNEPNGYQRNENCIELRKDKGYLWNDISCSHQCFVICEALLV